MWGSHNLELRVRLVEDVASRSKKKLPHKLGVEKHKERKINVQKLLLSDYCFTNTENKKNPDNLSLEFMNFRVSKGAFFFFLFEKQIFSFS